MLRAVLIVAVSLGLCTTAQATGELHCTSQDGEAELHIGLGRVSIFAPLGADISTPAGTFSSDDGSIGAINGFYEPDAILVDFTDDIVLDVIARLRVFHAAEPGSDAMAGILHVVGDAVYAVTCEQG